ncbi:hypothetical protein Cgig2_003044 [Carnegiea gigantea]|uniref:Sulfurtransferase n=1 Tax=Carnegiea gigantea TaxID=171969 RepID=A0A9Q1JT05_9CARY|nr:hypothetical protein Cgig2_003044 [Carnegiea gigantea]
MPSVILEFIRETTSSKFKLPVEEKSLEKKSTISASISSSFLATDPSSLLKPEIKLVTRLILALVATSIRLKEEDEEFQGMKEENDTYVRKNIEDKTYQLVDARSKARFDGTAPEPRMGIRSGHVPGSKCVPFSQVLDSSGTLLPADQLKEKFEQEGINLEQPIVTSCGTGVAACVLALGLHRLGKTDVAVYDGSWTEWGGKLDTAVEAS